ncbi:MAG: hypothetical protein IPN05_14510 [Sulfuritalea sp.]|nr:hypothetical protein [Sulfuritalea sp.]
MESPTWVFLARRSEHRIGDAPLGADEITFSAQATCPRCESSCSGVSWGREIKEFLDIGLGQMHVDAETSIGIGDAASSRIARVIWLRSMARSASHASRRSSLLAQR